MLSELSSFLLMTIIRFQRVEYSANYLHHYMNLTFVYRFDAKGKE